MTLVDDNGNESIERMLDNKNKNDFERGATDDFLICTPRDENLGQLTSVNLRKKTSDVWEMDQVSSLTILDRSLMIG